jgi:hypothetical protein
LEFRGVIFIHLGRSEFSIDRTFTGRGTFRGCHTSFSTYSLSWEEKRRKKGKAEDPAKYGAKGRLDGNGPGHYGV